MNITVLLTVSIALSVMLAWLRRAWVNSPGTRVETFSIALGWCVFGFVVCRNWLGAA